MSSGILKVSSGIDGLDEITRGGLPLGRPSLICGGAGCGKTVMALQFLMAGVKSGENALFLSFEERPDDIVVNFRSMDWDIDQYVDKRKLLIEYIHVEPEDLKKTGDFTLDALLLRMQEMVKTYNIKRIAIDTLESLISGLQNDQILRSEFRKLFFWIKSNNLTAVVTAESGDGRLTRYGLEEYVSDCVFVLEQNIKDDLITRQMRIIKYRGSDYGMNLYPFMINSDGINVIPITSVGLDYEVTFSRVSSGLPELDEILGGGYYVGSSVLISGTAGTGKSSLASCMVNSICAERKKCLYIGLEESRKQIIRNMSSIGINLQPFEDSGLLKFHNVRPSLDGLESHLVRFRLEVQKHQPDLVVIDPISNLISISNSFRVRSMLTRFIDFLKLENITSIFTDLMHDIDYEKGTSTAISSVMDTWIAVTNIRTNGNFTRQLRIIKSRGMSHSNHIHEFKISDDSILIQL